jgi:PKD repeat protein
VVTCSSQFDGFDPVLAVYAGSSLDALEEVAGNDDSGRANCSTEDGEVRFAAVAGTTYRIAVDGKEGGEGSFQLQFSATGPANDDFEDAIDVPHAPAVIAGNNAGAGAQPGEGGGAEQTVWYRLVAQRNGLIHLHTCSEGGAPMDLSVYTGPTVGSLSPVTPVATGVSPGCALPPRGSSFGDTPVFAFEAVAGTTYRIAVDRYLQISPVFELKPAGPFQLVVDPPAGDLRAGSESLPVAGGSFPRSNVGATREPDEVDHAGEEGGASVWFRWFASATGPVRIETCGSEVDTLLAVYGPGQAPEPEDEGSAAEQYGGGPPSLPPAPGGAIAASDDSDLCGEGSTRSSLDLAVQEGVEYLIAVDGKAGETGPLQLNVAFETPDTTPPETQAFIPPATKTHQLAFNLFRDEPESRFECAVDGAPFAPCDVSGPDWSLVGTISGLEEGSHTLAVREVDVAGNLDPAPVTADFAVDFVPPQTTIASGPQGLTKELGPYLFSSNEPGGFECWVDKSPPFFCSSPHAVSSHLADGDHLLHVRAVDLAGNADQTPDTRSFHLDRTPPVAAVDAGPEGTVESDMVEFEFSANEPATFRCQLDDRPEDDCESPRIFAGVGDGDHDFTLTPTDAAGNEGKAVTYGFLVENRPPQTEIVEGPLGRVGSTSASFEFDADEPVSGFECSLDEAAFAACGNPDELRDLAEGEHRLLVRAIDVAGKRDPTPAARTWTVDVTAPETTIAGGPTGLTNKRGPFTFGSDEPVFGFECSLDEADFDECTSGYLLPFATADGEHTLRVRAIDEAGNTDPTPVERTLTLDRTGPGAEILTPPPPVTGSSVVVDFELDEDATGAECQVDSQSFLPCASPIEFKGMPDGPHTISIRGVDSLGNRGPVAGAAFTVDGAPPETGINAKQSVYFGPGPVEIGFHGSADAIAYECSLDAEPFAECSSPAVYEELDEGVHEFQVRALDPAGNLDPTPAALSFTVDATAPETTITAGPSGPVHVRTLPFEYESSEEPQKFECALDEGEWRGCATVLAQHRPGDHLFAVRAIDRAGNVDATPATQAFTIVNQDPVPTLVLDRLAGPAPLTVNAEIGGSDGDGDPLGYSLEWGSSGRTSGAVPASGLSHTYAQPGVYLVRVEIDDGFGTVVATQVVTVTLPEPQRADAGDDLTAVAGEPVVLDGTDSRPLAGIDEYRWKLTGGGSSDQARFAHTFAEPGNYEAELTVSGSGGKDNDVALVHVVAPSGGVANVLTRHGATPLQGVQAMVILPDGRRVEAVSGNDGVARLRGLPEGSHKVFAHKSGYVHSVGDVVVDAGGAGSGEVELEPGDTGAIAIESRRMTLDEIKAAGIDTGDPANLHVYEFTFGGNFKGCVGPNGFIDCGTGGGGGGGGCTVSACSTGRTTIVSDWSPQAKAPMLAAITVPARATFLKEFFDITVTVTNLAEPGITFEDGNASIWFRDGMSLAPTPTPQQLSRAVPDVPGGGSRTLHWILRGDVEGDYSVGVSYEGRLDPFETPIQLRGETKEPIKVWGGSALKLKVDLDEEARDRYPFTGIVKLENVADIPVYNVGVELLQSGKVGYIEQPRQRHGFGTSELLPGATLNAGPFVLVPDQSGQLDLSRSFLRKVAGDVDLQGTIVTHPRSPKFSETPQVEVRGYGDKLVLDWEPVAGAVGYEVFRTFDRQVDFPPDPLAVDQLDPTRAVVRGIDPDQHAFYGISSLLNPQEMVHPLTFGRGEMNREWPKLAVAAGDRCDSREMAVTLRFETLDFELAGYEMSLNDLPFGSPQPLDGYSGSETVHVPFATGDEDADFEVTVRDVEGTERTTHANLACDYIALGDSYASGEGVPGFEAGSHENGNHCHRSDRAYSRLLAADDSLRPRVGDRLRFHACSGAELEDMFEPNNDHSNEGPQLNYLDEGAHLVTLSIGGNDMRFADTVEDCTLGGGVIALDPYCRNNHEAGIQAGRKKVEEKLPRILRMIRSRAPRARILVVEYPEIFPRFPVDPVDGFNAALAGSVPAAALKLVMSCNSILGDNIFPWDLIWLSHEQREANAMFRRTVEGAGVGAEYVSMDRFVGHDSCQEAGAWLHAGNMGHGVGDFVYSFHPNERGQREMYEAIKEQLSHQRPADGGFTISAGEVVRKVATIGGQRVAKAAFSHWWPGSDVELELRSPAGRVVGRDTVADDVEHSLTGTFESYAIDHPEPGEWELTFRGVEVDPGGEPVSFQVAELPEVNVAPTPLFRQSTNGGPTGTVVSFDASESSDDDGTIEEYEWNFGDGSFGSGIEVNHAFAHPGRYTVRLLVRDDGGEAALHGQEEIWIRDEPQAVADSYQVDAGGELNVSTAVGLLANDTVDHSGGDPRIEVINGAAHGTFDLAPGGGFRYLPDAGFAGTETMTYRLSDAGDLVSAPADVRIEVRSAPVDPGAPGPSPPTSPAGGGAPPASGVSAVASPPKRKPLKCRKGFKRKKVRGKLRCVKERKKKRTRSPS